MALGAWEANGGAESREAHGSGERVRRLAGGWSRAHGRGRQEARGCGGLVARGVGRRRWRGRAAAATWRLRGLGQGYYGD